MRDKDVESFFGGAGSRRALEASSTQAHAPDDISPSGGVASHRTGLGPAQTDSERPK